MMKTETNCNILVINPGSTSTRLAVFKNSAVTASRTVTQSTPGRRRYSAMPEGADLFMSLIRTFLSESGIDRLDAIAARGGLMRPLEGGVYRVNERMRDDLESCRFGVHASNAGALCAHALSEEFRCPAYIADPVVVDEMYPFAKVTGLPEIERRSVFHALNQKAAARIVADKLGKRYDECDFIVAHMGGGISVGAHCKGRVVDVNNALDGDGPFSPERAGRLPAGDCARFVLKFEGQQDSLLRKITGEGGLVAHFGTSRLEDLVEGMRNSDKKAALLFNALAFQIGKEIAMHGATLKGSVDAIILTGGMANCPELCEAIIERVSFLAPVHVLPGEKEMEALAESVLRVLRGQETAKEY